MECYQDPILIQKDYELPMTMDMLIDLVRKAENNNDGRNMDMRNLVISLIHRYAIYVFKLDFHIIFYITSQEHNSKNLWRWFNW